MKLLHNIGNQKHSNYNTREQLISCEEPLSFDGVYKNVYRNKDIIPTGTLLFITGDYIGGDNSFDLAHVPKLEEFCDWNEIMELVTQHGCLLGWHTWSHPDLTTLTREQIVKEITPPFPMHYFAYPYGKYNDQVKELVSEIYQEAWSVTQGDGSQYARVRTYL